MTSAQFKEARLRAGMTQQAAAARLGVSQPYYSQLESGARRAPAELARRAVKQLHLTAATLPLPPLCAEAVALPPERIQRFLGGLGYPGFARARGRGASVNPAELVARTLAHDDLDVRLVEGIPWVLARFPELDWGWLTTQCRAWNVQNRLGFLAALAGVGEPLAELEASRLAQESTLCRDSMPEAERRWVRQRRGALAEHWNLLTTMTAEQLADGT
ncbi:MAG: helix-turn-helix transcriptional regulator [Bryobacterales bacterium]|nr:helix-turn-helix transcriptional regulator [Bryobacterales bacterium]